MVPEFRHIRQELRVVTDRRVGNLESTIPWPKCDHDVSRRAVFADDFDAPHHGVERRKTLLTIDDQRRCTKAWAFCSESARVFVVGRVPEYERSHGETQEKRVEEIPYLCVFPDEGALQVRQGDHLKLDVAHQRSNGALTVLEDWRPPTNPWLPRSADIVLVRAVIELCGIFRLGDGLWLRQLAADDAADVGDRFGDMIFETHRTPHARHRRVNETVEPILEHGESFRRVLHG